MDRFYDFVKSPISWLIAVLGGVLALWLTGFLGQLLPSSERTWLAIKNVVTVESPRPDEKFRFVLSWLVNDSNGEKARIVGAAFREIPGIELRHSASMPRASGAADDWIPAMRKQARKIMDRWQADIVIAGEFVTWEDEERLKLWIIPREGDGTLGDRANHPYEVINASLLPEFREDLRTQLVVYALKAVAPLADTEVRGQVLKEELVKAVDRVANLLDDYPDDAPNRADLQNAYADASWTLGERESGTDRLEAAVAAYRKALEERTRERVPLQWATTQSSLGSALTRLGERESGTDRLEAAVAAYRKALEERTRERVPLQWATTQSNLSSALFSLGERESGTDRLEEAVDALHEALKEFTREHVPLDWATVQSNLGSALSRLGERESGTGRLEEAVAA